ncbi:MAG TPA: class I SAM-dependent methyltransferase [Planctomycetota bacterium]|nr:class I SAM-dependent methyltransferase [Planctomycetota bacterium]
MSDPIDVNRRYWDELAALHVHSGFYDVAGFKAGRCTLRPLDLEAVGDVTGKRLLHLMCHFGLDTLSWARRGARVTGCDFSAKAIELARNLAAECDIPAEFVCANLDDLPEHLSGEFDVVFTSEGVIPWLPDLKRWGEVIAHFLTPGGVFYVRNAHPFAAVFDDGADVPAIADPYFSDGKPRRWENCGASYAVGEGVASPHHYEWTHTLSDVINALVDAGLRIEHVQEYPYVYFRWYPFMTQHEDGFWHWAEYPDAIPFMFSIRATK